MSHNFFGETVQLFVTAECGMECLRCKLKGQDYSDMTEETFQDVVFVLPKLGVKRVELFANDPLMHPRIGQFVRVLNNADIKSAILTVGANRRDAGASIRFLKLLEVIDPSKVSFVFSVDHTEAISDEILMAGESHPEFPAAFKAKAFWRLEPALKDRGIQYHTNTVISRYNFNEVKSIAIRVASMGGLVSFCHAQHTPPGFHKAFNGNGLSPVLEESLRLILDAVGFLSCQDIENIVKGTHGIVAGREKEFFNHFRGENPADAYIPEGGLYELQEDLLGLKKSIGEKILPSEDYIRSIGSDGPGCINLLMAGKFPQIKVGTEGQMVFCCDLHDPLTQSYKLRDMYDPEISRAFYQMIRVNPYIWFCLLFKCNWSVNHVKHATRKEEVYAR